MVDDETLAIHAAEAIKTSYSPFSKVTIGAAVLGEKGVYLGSNVEFTSTTAIHAEVVALINCLRAGDKALVIAVACVWDNPTPGCGACRQAMIQANQDLKVIGCNGQGKINIVSSIKELYPHSYVSKPRK